MSDKHRRQILIISESIPQSLARDAGTFATFVSMIGIGWFIESEAMQWAGAILGFLTTISVATHYERIFTIVEARAELDRLESQP